VDRVIGIVALLKEVLCDHSRLAGGEAVKFNDDSVRA